MELRHVLRAYALEGHEPHRIPQLMDRLLVHFHPEITATMCLLVLDTRSGTMDIVNAGHLPLARHLTRRRRGLLCPSMARCWASTSITSPPRPPWLDDGDLLLMVTDGLIERPRIDLAVSLEDLLPARRRPLPHPAVPARRAVASLQRGRRG
ncbi:SpoIIE family protein phosphatase [Streptomyces sp. KL116D]|uniref:SpoIIE family protein phosphatase n=1 Tax=Streptomyces sp. KL116D TaxID=3045152 RepID=UPI003556A499